MPPPSVFQFRTCSWILISAPFFIACFFRTNQRDRWLFLSNCKMPRRKSSAWLLCDFAWNLNAKTKNRWIIARNVKNFSGWPTGIFTYPRNTQLSPLPFFAEIFYKKIATHAPGRCRNFLQHCAMQWSFRIFLTRFSHGCGHRVPSFSWNDRQPPRADSRRTRTIY